MPHDIKNYVAGKFIGSERRFEDIDPTDGSHVATGHEAYRELVDDLVAAAPVVSAMRPKPPCWAPPWSAFSGWPE